MKRLFWLLLGLTLIALPLPAAAGDLTRPTVLRDHAVVDGDVIRLGDLFEGVGAAGEAIIAYAPAPGHRAIFDAAWLGRVAHKYQISWRPQGHLHRIVVERRSTVVGREHLEAVVRDELMLLGFGEGFELVLANANLKVHIPAEQPPTVEVASLAVDDRTGRFVAMLRIPAGDPNGRAVKVTGRVHAVIEIPVLTHQMGPGETIGADDVSWQRLRRMQVRDNTISDVADLVGLEPRRRLRANMALRHADLRPPLAVHKGAAVTMIAQSPAMTLTATGRALDSGSRDDVVRVMNSRTKVVVEATVIGPERVAIVLPGTVPAFNGATQ